MMRTRQLPQRAEVYLDNNATTAMSAATRACIAELLEALPGNASSAHSLGRLARDHLEHARARFAHYLGGARIIFTSGGTESNGLCLLGALRHAENGYEQLVVSDLEHSSVYSCVELSLADRAFSCPARADGTPDLEHLEELVARGRSLVSMMHVNNETGVIFPIAEIAALTHRHGGLLHVDAVQSVGKMPIDDVIQHADALTISGHKFHGPQGVGAIAILNPQFKIAPVLPGGGQEHGLRGGTENVPAIAAMAVALEEAMATEPPGPRQRDRLEAFVGERVPEALIVARTSPRIWTTSYICFPALLQDDLIEELSARGVHVGSGAACATGQHESRVLKSMGVPSLYNQGGVRISFSRLTPPAAVERFMEVFPDAYAAAREKSPYL